MNTPSLILSDPYGADGPLPLGEYNYRMLIRRHLSGFSQPYEYYNNPSYVQTPAGTLREGIRIHAGNLSKGCLTTATGQQGRDIEHKLLQL